MSPAHAREIEKKTKLLRADYGGMMTIKQLMSELNYSSHHPVYTWLRKNNVEGIRMGRSVRYECDQIAKIIVDARGMV